MPAGGKLAVRVKPDTSRMLPGQETSCLRIDVQDIGSGIPEEHLMRIFDPFFTTKPPGKGTGLGLAISARIIEGFGGKIEVQSRTGEGTCFSLWLPSGTTKEPVT
jgi:signal transduction histidine kinase